MNDITPFNYGDNLIRVINDETTSEPLWIAKDVCKVLQINNHRDALNRLDEDEKGVVSTDTLGGTQNMTVVNESGLYSLILSSRKPEAKPFKRWVTHEVLPAIRKTGSYSLNQTNSIDMSSILSIMETQSRIMETMQVQNTLMLSMIHSINDSIDANHANTHLGVCILIGGMKTLLKQKDTILSSGDYTFPNAERISSDQRNILYTTVMTRASYIAESFCIKTDVIASAIFAALKTRFKRSHYSDIEIYQFDEAIEFVNTFEISERR